MPASYLLAEAWQMAECSNLKGNLKNCKCTYAGCSRKGKCCDCLKYHLSRSELPACCFSEKAEASYDRSFGCFIEDKGGFIVK